MSNSTKTLLERKAVKLGQLSSFDLPPFPPLPESFLNRFPELRPYEEEKRRWLQNLTLALSRIISAPQQ